MILGQPGKDQNLAIDFLAHLVAILSFRSQALLPIEERNVRPPLIAHWECLIPFMILPAPNKTESSCLGSTPASLSIAVRWDTTNPS